MIGDGTRSGRVLTAALFAALASVTCTRTHERDDLDASRAAPPIKSTATSAFVWPLSEDASRPEPRRGMLWIPGGVLIAGTRRDREPRVTDEELTGVTFEMRGFYIDEFAYPNEAGAIPKTGTSREEAAGLCTQVGKRLCTELEWERACKGRDNSTYEYGDVYRPQECGTGAAGRLVPSGLHVACKSSFGVHDLHGGPWEWTASSWRRGASSQLGTVRGGNAEAGELVGRCANAMALAPSTKRADLGLRCCAGEANTAEVQLAVVQGQPLEARRSDAKMLAALGAAMAPKVAVEGQEQGAFRVDRTWSWHPVGNEELLVAAGCAKTSGHLACGVGVFRESSPESDARDGATPKLVAFASSGWWMSVVRTDRRDHDLWVYGGDGHSSFRTRVAYVWGRVALGEPERPPRRGELP